MPIVKQPIIRTFWCLVGTSCCTLELLEINWGEESFKLWGQPFALAKLIATGSWASSYGYLHPYVRQRISRTRVYIKGVFIGGKWNEIISPAGIKCHLSLPCYFQVGAHAVALFWQDMNFTVPLTCISSLLLIGIHHFRRHHILVSTQNRIRIIISFLIYIHLVCIHNILYRRYSSGCVLLLLCLALNIFSNYHTSRGHSSGVSIVTWHYNSYAATFIHHLTIHFDFSHIHAFQYIITKYWFISQLAIACTRTCIFITFCHFYPSLHMHIIIDFLKNIFIYIFSPSIYMLYMLWSGAGGVRRWWMRGREEAGRLVAKVRVTFLDIGSFFLFEYKHILPVVHILYCILITDSICGYTGLFIWQIALAVNYFLSAFNKGHSRRNQIYTKVCQGGKL